MGTRFTCRAVAAAVVAGLAWLVTAGPAATQPVRGDDVPAALPRPTWRVGDSWLIETVTDNIQVRDVSTDKKSPPIRWRFKVTGIVKKAGRPCYQVDVTCEAQARFRPASTLFIDAETMMLRELRTEVAGFGSVQTLHESYEPRGDRAAPVLSFGNVLPTDLPAFVPKASKDVNYTYVSQNTPAGAKDLGLIRFGHEVSQQVVQPGAKTLEQVHPQYAKALDSQAIVEVHLKSQDKSVVQLWQKGTPWPIYTNNGRTVAKLIPAGPSESRR